MNGEIVIIGLPSEGLQALAGGLGIAHLEDDEIRGANDNPDEARGFTPEQLLDRMEALFSGDSDSGALLVYQKPWKFLERQLKLSAYPPGTQAQMEWFAASVLGFWHAYHAALLGLHRQMAGRGLLLNGDRTVEAREIAALLEDRFGTRPGAQPESSKAAGPAAGHEEAYWQAVDHAAPHCLELYALLESCAELLGRQPEFGFGRFPRREGRIADLLQAELKALSPLDKAELYLRQLAQVQDELERQVELSRQKDRQIAELQHPPMLKLVRELKQAALRLLASVPGGGWIGRAGKWGAVKKQAEVIRASGLFDEQWYLQTYPDVARSGLDPVEHYLKFGVAEGRNPSAQFSTRWYLDAYSDVASNGLNPLVHYVEFGRHEKRRPMKARRAAAVRA